MTAHEHASHDSPNRQTCTGAAAGHSGRFAIDRRTLLQTLGALGIGTLTFRRALAVQAEQAQGITPEMIEQAEWIAGLELEPEQREATAEAMAGALERFEALRGVPLENGVAPAVRFEVAGASSPADRPAERGEVRMSERAAPAKPSKEDDLAMLPLTELASLVRTRQVSSLELTRLYLDRLRRFDPVLKCVVSETEELALRQARRADRELASGRYRGPLHGIPWGAKDLIAYPGYKTTWGAEPFREQLLDMKATVAQRLDDAGAVLIAKLSLGTLAWGDRWFGGLTRNPWDPRQGSSGSSAGSAAATAAGLVGFSLGSETLGSIVSPCRRCGVSGLRPTYGRVSRHGCMTLSWSMDKIGPIARSVEDCALIFAALHGADGLDPTAVDRPFHWPAGRDPRTLRVGYFENDLPLADRPELQVLKELGVRLLPISLPDDYPVSAMTIILNTEAAAVFDELSRKTPDEQLGRWPNALRQGQFVPAVEYLRANRIRTLLMREMERVMERVDAYVGGDDLALTNLTGHPTVVLPGPLQEVNGVSRPSSLTFTGRLFGESELLSLAHAYQQETGDHLARPDFSALLKVEEPDE